MSVNVGTVTTWDTGCTPREQVEKMASEVMEVFEAVSWYSRTRTTDDWDTHVEKNDAFTDVMDECADVITATCNLLSMLGITDFTDMMRECAERQRERGRL